MVEKKPRWQPNTSPNTEKPGERAAFDPHTKERQRPAGTVPTSLDVVEGFFGEAINGKTAEKIRSLPLSQANALIEQLYDHIRPVLAAFHNRGNEPKREAPAEYKYLETGEIHANDDVVLRSSKSPDISTASILKHLALYCDRALVWDPLMIPQAGRNRPRPPEHWIPMLAHGVTQLLPIADLVRAGHFVLARTTPLEMSHSFNGLLLSEDVISDPYNAYLIETAMNNDKWIANAVSTSLARQRMFASMDELERAGPYVTDAITKLYPMNIDRNWLRRIVAYTSEVHRYRFTPIVSDPLVKFHMEQGNRIILGEEPQKTRPKAHPLEPLMRFHIPDLSNLSYNDIFQLRQDEAVFAELRSALRTLMHECAQTDRLETAGDYREFLYESGKDIVGPAFNNLQRMQRRARVKSILGQSAFKGLTFGLDSFISLASEAVEEGGRPFVGKKSRRRLKNIKLANKVLQSISRYR